jgi:hypothetical protein
MTGCVLGRKYMETLFQELQERGSTEVSSGNHETEEGTRRLVAFAIEEVRSIKCAL